MFNSKVRRGFAVIALSLLGILASSQTGCAGPSPTVRFKLHAVTKAPVAGALSSASDVVQRRLIAFGISDGTVVRRADGLVVEVRRRSDREMKELETLIVAKGDLELAPVTAADAGATVLHGDGFVVSQPVTAKITDDRTLQVTLSGDDRARFASLSTRHVGTRVGIIVDGDVLASPIVRVPVQQGHLEITTRSVEPSLLKRLAALLAGGPLPLQLTLLPAADHE